ncbi:CKLF-like MARVEL transmembrane domain-containing protein 7 [Sinocyclocheilus rhinocerous]|uniref:CKLF-like MARVEL transmembrane domain-containing protein 7 n=1 Tax=Sinocyclocheilus rhinocerous TaxID=307959 RepID=A0A673JF17_9TELE|nr:PREDICTED: CKLF-like MARVEL transmembrane domain-containing protein 7 [Sinocyclocheilus rhinocerous]
MPHTVVTTTTTTTTSTSDGGFCNTGYARSFQGLLKIGQVVILLIALLCVHYEHRRIEYSAFHYFEVVTAWFLIVFSIFFLMHLFRLQSKITCINWTLTEFLHYAVGGILVFIASIVVAVKSYGVSALIAGSVFGFIATFLIAISIWTSYKVTCGSQPTGAAV